MLLEKEWGKEKSNNISLGICCAASLAEKTSHPQQRDKCKAQK